MLKVSGKKIYCVLLMHAGLVFCTDSSAVQAVNHQGAFILDQSQEVFFEQFLPNTYALQLLQVKNKFNHDDLVLGGMAEADLQYWDGDKIPTTLSTNYQKSTGLYLTQATLDVMANVTRWSTLFFSLADSQVGQGGPNGNYYYIKHAFILLGNLDVFPVYATIGINTIPFGVFAGSGVWDVPLTYVYFSSQQAPQIALSYLKIT